MGESDRERQRHLFDEPRDPVWGSEQLKRIAEEGFYWTPEGPRNGAYVAPERAPEEPREPGRARPRSGTKKGGQS